MRRQCAAGGVFARSHVVESHAPVFGAGCNERVNGERKTVSHPEGILVLAFCLPVDLAWIKLLTRDNFARRARVVGSRHSEVFQAFLKSLGGVF